MLRFVTRGRGGLSNRHAKALRHGGRRDMRRSAFWGIGGSFGGGSFSAGGGSFGGGGASGGW
ncbi:MAG: hypothetical protein ABSD52_11580 [Candidatus Cybelea sp.]